MGRLPHGRSTLIGARNGRERRRPRRDPAGGALLLAVALLTGGCALTGGPGSSLTDESGGAGGWGAGLFDTTPGTPYVFGAMTVCVSGKVPVTVLAVTPARQLGRISVDAFAVRPNPSQLGGEEYGDGQGTLRDLNRGIGPFAVDARGLDPDGSKVVRGQCHTGQVQSELAVQLSRQSSVTAAAQGIRVEWVPGTDPHGSGRRSFVVPATFTLCSRGDRTTDGCT